MKKSQLIFTQYSPLLAVDIDITGIDGEKTATPIVFSLCRCGASKNKPFCDGTHSQIGFTGQRDNSQKAEPERYRGKNITIIFDRFMCMGDGHCGELEAVFGTHDEPKYEPDAASADEIIETIKKCPSGALSYSLNDEQKANYFLNTQIVVEKNGPYHCHGDINLIDDQNSDSLLPKGDHYTLCRCGASKKKPFCDGTHLDIDFKG